MIYNVTSINFFLSLYSETTTNDFSIIDNAILAIEMSLILSLFTSSFAKHFVLRLPV